MTYFLIFLAVVVAAVAGVYLVGLKKPQTDTAAYEDVLSAPVANLPPVLLPGKPVASDVDKLRFSLGLRGYRMDQVDEVLDRLRDELAAKDLRIAELEASATAGATADTTADIAVAVEVDDVVPVPAETPTLAEPVASTEPVAPAGSVAPVQPDTAS